MVTVLGLLASDATGTRKAPAMIRHVTSLSVRMGFPPNVLTPGRHIHNSKSWMPSYHNRSQCHESQLYGEQDLALAGRRSPFSFRLPPSPARGCAADRAILRCRVPATTRRT